MPADGFRLGVLNGLAALPLLVACGSGDKSGEFYTRWDLEGGCTSDRAGADRSDAFGEQVDVCEYASPGWVWVTYAAGWCSASRNQAPQIRRLAQIAGRDVEVFTVLTGGSEFGAPATQDDARAWVNAHGLPAGRVLFESEEGARTVPQHLLIGPDGRTWFRYVGYLEVESMRQLLDEFADGRRRPEVRQLRSGGFNQTGVGAANISGVEDLFDKETADTYEAGVKALFLERRLSANLSAFFTQAEGSYFFVYDPNTGTQNLGNLDEVDFMGFELELQAVATDWLELYARFGYTDSEIQKSGRDPDDVGNQAPLVSEHTINLGAQIYGPLPFGEDLSYFIRPDFQIIGDTYRYPDNYSVRDPVNLLNLRAGFGNDVWTVTAWARNLADEDYNAEWSPGPQFFSSPGYTNNFVFKAQPRVWGAELTYRF